MTAKTKGPKFTGALGEPIPVQLDLIVEQLAHGDTKRVWDQCRKKQIEKFTVLLKHYGIEVSHPDAWLSLAFCLALDFVPGMQIVEYAPRRRGAPYDGQEAMA